MEMFQDRTSVGAGYFSAPGIYWGLARVRRGAVRHLPVGNIRVGTIPVGKIRKQKSTQQLLSISVNVLNKGLRPHLTMWQAKYRRWWQQALEDQEKREMTPQQVQRTYPQYGDLIADMKNVNRKLMAYGRALDRIVRPNE